MENKKNIIEIFVDENGDFVSNTKERSDFQNIIKNDSPDILRALKNKLRGK